MSGVALAYSPDGRRFATFSAKRIKLWDTQSGELIRSTDYKNHCLSKASDLSIDFSPNGKRLVASACGMTKSYCGEVTVWEAETLRQIERLDGIYACGGKARFKTNDTVLYDEYAYFSAGLAPEYTSGNCYLHEAPVRPQVGPLNMKPESSHKISP